MEINLERLRIYKNKDNMHFYPYRTARVLGLIEISNYEDYSKLQKELCDLLGVTPDNHTCFTIGDTAIMFSDEIITIGNSNDIIIN